MKLGDPRRCRKKWKGPSNPWVKEVLLYEMELMGAYGLRNKRELWIAKTTLRRIRRQARELLALPRDERKEEALVSKLCGMGILDSEDSTLDDVLNLTVKDILERRLQTVVYRMGLANSIYHARQLISHGHVSIGDRRVTCPGHVVSREEEVLIRISHISPHAVEA